LARQVVRSKGRLSAEDVRVFLRAGFTQAQLLEILVGISMTAIANYMHNIAKTPIDEVFQIQSWSASA
jgi:alkylhydroperoxidase family enzyme